MSGYEAVITQEQSETPEVRHERLKKFLMDLVTFCENGGKLDAIYFLAHHSGQNTMYHAFSGDAGILNSIFNEVVYRDQLAVMDAVSALKKTEGKTVIPAQSA